MSHHIFTLAPHDHSSIDALIDELAALSADSQDPRLVARARLLAQELPRSLRQFLLDFSDTSRSAGACVVRGFGISDTLGPTPEHPRGVGARHRTFREEVYLLMLAELTGHAFGWTSQFEGQLTQDIVPVKANETAQVSSSSTVTLDLHVEEAFHPLRPDFLALMCLRNPDRTPTTWVSMDDVQLSPSDVACLFESKYPVVPDDSYFRGRTQEQDDDDAMAEETRAVWQKIQQLREVTVPSSVFFGARDAPYICLDVPFTRSELLEEPHRGAWARLCRELEARTVETVLEPGDVIFLDNFRTAHGRRPYTPRYDGLDRWLMRIQIAVDLRKSRGVRRHAEARVLF
jgi:Fe(II)/alpha-ketoglutarate-dependent arginine beta-hydroxylase